MLKSHWKTLQICFMVKLPSNRQATLSPENFENTLGSDLSLFIKKYNPGYS